MGCSLHLWFCACKTATLGPDLQVCIGLCPHLLVLSTHNSGLAQEYQDYTGSSPHLWFCACKTSILGQEL